MTLTQRSTNFMLYPVGCANLIRLPNGVALAIGAILPERSPLWGSSQPMANDRLWPAFDFRKFPGWR
jgi:hypothetical protein